MQPALVQPKMIYIICKHCYHAFNALDNSPSALDKTCRSCFWDPSAEEHRKQIGIIKETSNKKQKARR